MPTKAWPNDFFHPIYSSFYLFTNLSLFTFSIHTFSYHIIFPLKQFSFDHLIVVLSWLFIFPFMLNLWWWFPIWSSSFNGFWDAFSFCLKIKKLKSGCKDKDNNMRIWKFYLKKWKFPPRKMGSTFKRTKSILSTTILSQVLKNITLVIKISKRYLPIYRRMQSNIAERMRASYWTME